MLRLFSVILYINWYFVVCHLNPQHFLFFLNFIAWTSWTKSRQWIKISLDPFASPNIHSSCLLASTDFISLSATIDLWVITTLLAFSSFWPHLLPLTALYLSCTEPEILQHYVKAKKERNCFVLSRSLVAAFEGMYFLLVGVNLAFIKHVNASVNQSFHWMCLCEQQAAECQLLLDYLQAGTLW